MAVVLIVDDSPTEVHVMRGWLEKGGHTVLAASDGDEGIRMAHEQRPDLIFMDVVMPGLNGFQATRTLAREPATANIPVIIVTTKNQETDRIWALRQGAVDYLVKPVSESDLVAKVNQWLNAPA